MFPTLRNKDKVMLKRVAFGNLRLREIIVFKQGPQRICHRIVKIDRKHAYVYARGDFNSRGVELVKEENLLGKVTAVISGNKIHSLGLRKTILYYLLIRLAAYSKDLVMFFIDTLYGKSIFRKFLKRISAGNIQCYLVEREKDAELFNSIYNFLPAEMANYSISERILCFYKGRFAGKLLVSKDDSAFWLWGPHLRLFYRARGLGTELVKEAFKVVSAKGKFVLYALAVPQESVLRFYEGLGFIRESKLNGSSLWVLRKSF